MNTRNKDAELYLSALCVIGCAGSIAFTAYVVLTIMTKVFW